MSIRTLRSQDEVIASKIMPKVYNPTTFDVLVSWAWNDALAAVDTVDLDALHAYTEAFFPSPSW